MVNWIEKINGTPLGGVLRTAGLWILILADVSMLFWLYATGNFIWFGVFLAITLWIILAEAWGMIIGYHDHDGYKKMTISTAYKRYIQHVGWIGYIPLALFWIAMTGLVVHLAFW
jgi:hypothetical protein